MAPVYACSASVPVIQISCVNTAHNILLITESHCSQCMELTYAPHITCRLWLYTNNTHPWQAFTQVQGLVDASLKPLSHRLPLSLKHTKDCTIVMLVVTYIVSLLTK